MNHNQREGCAFVSLLVIAALTFHFWFWVIRAIMARIDPVEPAPPPPPTHAL
jgi:hypothetical protein